MVNRSYWHYLSCAVLGLIITLAIPSKTCAADLPAETVFDIFGELQQALHTVDLKHFAKLVDNQAGLHIKLKDTGQKDFEITLYPFEFNRLKKDDRLLDTIPPLPLYTIFYGRQRFKGGELRARADFANPGISRPFLFNLNEYKSNKYETIKSLIAQKRFLLENRSRWLIFWTPETENTASLHRWQIDIQYNIVLNAQDYVLHKINGYWYLTDMEIYPGRP